MASASGAVASFFIPGLALYLYGPRFWGRLALWACGLMLLVFFTELGRPAGNIAFGLLLSIHATGLNFFAEPWLTGSRFRLRVFVSLAILAALGMGIYLPARSFLEAHLFAPLQLDERVVVVKKFGTMSDVRRGEWIAYSLAEGGDHGAYVRAGMGLGPVLAGAGDRVRFTPTTLEVNGVAQPRSPFMPDSGELLVPEKHWFVWPDFAISGHGNVPDNTITATILPMATITEDQFGGRPFKRWFWHRQFK